MKQTLSTLALSSILAIASTGFAQTAAAIPAPTQNATAASAHHGKSPDAQADRLAKKLKLSADQENQIKPILADRQQQMRALHQDQSVSREDRMAKAKTLRADSNTKIEAVLNDTQKQKFEQMQAKQQQRLQSRKQQGSGATPATSAS